ncbi:hypothetical protein RRG08_024067 [Elysia crispata]|uniref:Uncharacterized protein n=1 Tax=Elysia crispata TaxID=231223 RepID=A0AAE0ZPA5_9GAST|nr:hypothetical protein RRG08_024067 [Elysia crispata]
MRSLRSMQMFIVCELSLEELSGDSEGVTDVKYVVSVRACCVGTRALVLFPHTPAVASIHSSSFDMCASPRKKEKDKKAKLRSFDIKNQQALKTQIVFGDGCGYFEENTNHTD